jgi:hypothetical protein
VTKYEWISIILQAVLAVGAVVFALWQILINKRLQRLQDYVAVAAVPHKDGKIELLNTGKINLYLHGFDIWGKVMQQQALKVRFGKSRMIPAGAGDAAYYWIDPPPNLEKIQGPYDFDFRLFLKDEFEKEWISEHGGTAIPAQVSSNVTEVRFFVWSYKMYRKQWLESTEWLSGKTSENETKTGTKGRRSVKKLKQ